MWKLLARRLPVNSYLRRRPAPSSSSSSSSPSPAPPAVDHALDTAMPAPAPASFSALPAATGVMAELPHTLPLPLHVNVSPAIPAPSRSAAVQHDRQTAPAATPTETAAVATAVAATAAAAARPSTPDRSSPLPAALCVEPFHSCQRCHAPLETIEHVFFECPAIASFWPAFRKQFLAVIGMSDAEFPAIDLRAVVFFFPETRNALCAEELHALQVMHSIAIWCLWSVRSMTDADPRFIWSSFLSRLHARISLEYSNAIAADDTAITAIPSPTLSSAPSAEMRVSGAFSLSQSTLTVGAGRDDSPPASPTASQLSSVGSVWSSYSQSAAMSVAAKRRLSPTYGTIGVSAPGNPRQHRSRSISANSAILPPLYESPYDHQQSSSQIQDSQHHYQHHQLYSQSSVSSSQLSLSPSQYSQLSISPSRSFMYPHAKKTLPGSRPSSVQSHSQLSRFIATWSNNGSTPIVAITQTGLAFRAVPSISV
ncbi:hypothetical protein BC831DRAFT_449224 [Entophlyctis helioformis]|nr:hypothetical protein BC831DRAFT_449224 [Entophlyctis helioformis]